MIKISDKWKHGAIPALLIHGSIGTVYCWSLLRGAVEASIGSTCTWAFSLAIFFLGISAAFLGPFIERNVKQASFVSACCFGLGMILSGVACMIQSRLLLCLGYGVIMGIGVGIGYLSPVKTLMMWFKENKGFASGLAITGFGLAKVLGGPGFNYFLNHFGISEMFIFHGLLYFLIMLIAVNYLKKPEEENSGSLSLKEWWSDITNIIRLPKLWRYWIVFYLNITAGLAIISNEALIFGNLGVSARWIGWALSLAAVFNSIGRLGIAWWSDFVNNRSKFFGIILIFELIACTLGFRIALFIPFAILLCNAGYGAMFSIMPSSLHDKYGMENISKIHGIILSAWAFAGLTGNQIAHFILNIPNTNHRTVILGAGILYAISLWFSVKLWPKKTR